MKDRVLYSIVFGFAAGILFRSFIVLQFLVIIGIFFCSLLFFIIAILLRKQGYLVLLVLFTLSASLGMFRFHISDLSHGDPSFVPLVGKSVTFTGRIIEDPDVRENSTKILVEADTVNGRELAEKTNILATLYSGEPVHYGTAVTVSGMLSVPDNFLTNTGKEFDYISYLRKDDIYYLALAKDVTVTSHDGSRFILGLFAIKHRILESFSEILPNDESVFLGGLTLGIRTDISETLRQDFVTTGTIHVVALSGYNVTIVAEAVMRLFNAFLAIGASTIAGIIAIILFAVMAGGTSTVVRASIMSVLALIARSKGRSYDMSRALLLAGFLMLIQNPKILAFDVSFDLSFLSTLGIIYLAPIFEKNFTRVPERFGFRNLVAATLAAQIIVMPFILYEMGSVSLVALPVNALILPIIPETMLVGTIAGFAGIISKTLAIPFARIAYVPLHYMLGVVTRAAGLPYASLSIAIFPLWATIVLYILILYYVYSKQKNSSQYYPNSDS